MVKLSSIKQEFKTIWFNLETFFGLLASGKLGRRTFPNFNFCLFPKGNYNFLIFYQTILVTPKMFLNDNLEAT